MTDWATLRAERHRQRDADYNRRVLVLAYFRARVDDERPEILDALRMRIESPPGVAS